MSDHLGAVMAVGNTSTIHTWGRELVAKVLLPTTPSHWADLEADWTGRLYAVGLPVPEVVDVVTVDARRAILYRRVDGPSMLEEIVAHPSTLTTHARALAEVQAGFHQVPAPEGLMDLRVRMRAKIHEADLPEGPRGRAVERLASLPSGDVICHGDLHPGNVILASDRAVVVDWFDVAAGPPAADVTRTSLLVRPRRRTSPPVYLPGLANDMLHAFHEAWLAAYVGFTDTDVGVLTAWEVPVAAARLSEDVEREDLEAIVRADRPVDHQGESTVTHV